MITRPPLRCQPRGKGGQLRFGGRLRCFDTKEPGNNPFDIAVHDGCGCVMGNGDNGGGSVRADARQGQQCLARFGKAAGVVAHDHAGAFQQIARPRIIAKPGPFAHHLGIIRRRQRSDIRPARREAQEIVAHACDGCLLQHDFRQPDPVGVRVLPGKPVGWGHAPGQ